MRSLAVLLGAAAAALCVAGAAAAASGSRIVGVDASGYPHLEVTVEAPLGGPPPRLLENGVPAAGLQSVNLGDHKSVVLAVDRSRSMQGGPLVDAAAAARAFVAAKGAGDRIEVSAFGSRAVTLARFSSDPADADAALTGLRVDRRSGTALWDAVAEAASALHGQVASGRVIVVVTDGRDVSSAETLPEAIAAAHRAHAVVYAIGIGGAGLDPRPLRTLAHATGGSYLQAASSGQLAALYGSIGQRLAHTWQLRYDTAARPGERIALSLGDGATREFAVPGRPATAPPAAKPAVLPRTVWLSRLAPVALAAAVALLVLLACGFVNAAKRGSRLEARLAPHLSPSQPSIRRRAGRDGRPFRALFAVTETALSETRPFRVLQTLLVRAAVPLLASELLYLCLGAALVTGLLAAVAALPSLFILLAMAVGGALPVLWVRRKARLRMKAFDTQLPDLLITIAASLKAGHSFRQAVQAVVDEGAEPAASEFRRVVADTRLGRPIGDALAEMGERVGSKNLRFVLTSVSIQRQIGGSLAGLFDMVAETVRQRQQFHRKVRTLTAMGRMSAYVLGALPCCVALLITIISPAYMSPLWHTSTGHELVGAAVVMLGLGALLLGRIISFKG